MSDAHDTTDLLENEEDKDAFKPKIPPVAQKPSRFGPGAFQSGSKFGKGAQNFNIPNKQRPGRAANRGR